MYLLSAQDKNVFEELWEYFKSTYFSPEIPYMENISFGSGTLVTLKTMLYGLTIGLILASFITLYNKKYIGGFIRTLLKNECYDPSRAMTLDELGYSGSFGVMRAIRTDGTLIRWVRCAEEDEHNKGVELAREKFEEAHKNDKKPPKFKEPKFRRDLKTMHFYIPEEKRHAADIKFDDKGANWVSFLLVTVISLLICAFLSYTLPDIVKMLDNFISVMKR